MQSPGPAFDPYKKLSEESQDGQLLIVLSGILLPNTLDGFQYFVGSVAQVCSPFHASFNIPRPITLKVPRIAHFIQLNAAFVTFLSSIR